MIIYSLFAWYQCHGVYPRIESPEWYRLRAEDNSENRGMQVRSREVVTNYRSFALPLPDRGGSEEEAEEEEEEEEEEGL